MNLSTDIAFFLNFGSGNMPLQQEDIQRYHHYIASHPIKTPIQLSILKWSSSQVFAFGNLEVQLASLFNKYFHHLGSMIEFVRDTLKIANHVFRCSVFATFDDKCSLAQLIWDGIDKHDLIKPLSAEVTIMLIALKRQQWDSIKMYSLVELLAENQHIQSKNFFHILAQLVEFDDFPVERTPTIEKIYSTFKNKLHRMDAKEENGKRQKLDTLVCFVSNFLHHLENKGKHHEFDEMILRDHEISKLLILFCRKGIKYLPVRWLNKLIERELFQQANLFFKYVLKIGQSHFDLSSFDPIIENYGEWVESFIIEQFFTSQQFVIEYVFHSVNSVFFFNKMLLRCSFMKFQKFLKAIDYPCSIRHALHSEEVIASTLHVIENFYPTQEIQQYRNLLQNF